MRPGSWISVKLIAKLELTSPLWLKPLLGHKVCTRDPNGLATPPPPQAASFKHQAAEGGCDILSRVISLLDTFCLIVATMTGYNFRMKETKKQILIRLNKNTDLIKKEEKKNSATRRLANLLNGTSGKKLFRG